MANQSLLPDGFTPSTPTEMLLLNIIHRLDRELQLVRATSFQPWDRHPMELKGGEFPPDIRLPMTAKLSANIDNSGRLSVRMTGLSKDGDFGAAYYVEGAPFNRFQVADYLMEMHKDHLHRFAHFLENGRVFDPAVREGPDHG